MSFDEDDDDAFDEDAFLLCDAMDSLVAAKSERKKVPRPIMDEKTRLSDALLAAEAAGRALRAEVERSRNKIADWSELAATLVNQVVLSPARNVRFAAMAREIIKETMDDLDVGVRWIHCSFPATPKNKPKIHLEHFSEDASIFRIEWHPVWSVDVSLDVLLKSLVGLRVSAVHVTGLLRLRPTTTDCSEIAATFLDTPHVDIDVTATLNIAGSLTFRDLSLFKDRVSCHLRAWLELEIVHPN